MSDEHVSTIEFRSAMDGRAAPLELVIVEPQATHVVPLTRETRIAIGRARSADVKLGDDAVSDRHAVLEVRASDLRVEDVGSANGTWIAGQRVGASPEPLGIGEAVRVGSTVLVVRKRPPPPQHRRLWAHHYFMARLEEECERAAITGHGLALVRLRTALPREKLEAILNRHLSLTDVWAEFAGQDYELMLCPLLSGTGRRRLDGLRAALPDSRMAMAELGTSDGHRADQLLAVASDRLAGDTAGAGAVSLVAESSAMKELLRKIKVIASAKTAESILVLGETGTGKEVVARLLHGQSSRASKPFVDLNCAAIPTMLAEDQLFGHWKGAFTDAHNDRIGALEAADGGTLLLDEFQDIAPEIQVKLLRALEERQVHRLGGGGRKPKAIDVRVIAACSRDPAEGVRSNTFRADLYHRVSTFRLTVPPLREREADVAPLARMFLERFARVERKSLALSDAALALLESHSWPGNVRELRNAIQRGVVYCSEDQVEPEHLELPIVVVEPPDDPSAPKVTSLDGLSPEKAFRAILDAMVETDFRKELVAKRLGMSKRTLLNRMRSLGFPSRASAKKG